MRQSRSGVAGMGMSVMLNGVSASQIELITAGAAGIVPAWPTPFMPMGLVGLGVVVVVELVVDRFGRRGHQVVDEVRRRQLPTGVVHRFLPQRRRDALQHAAVHLAIRDHGVDLDVRTEREHEVRWIPRDLCSHT